MKIQKAYKQKEATHLVVSFYFRLFLLFFFDAISSVAVYFLIFFKSNDWLKR